jgi:hypothetical protein
MPFFLHSRQMPPPPHAPVSNAKTVPRPFR